MSADFLEQMAAGSRQRVDAARRASPDADLLARALASPLPPRLRRDPAGFDLIAEMKLRSPAVGQLKSGEEDVGARVTSYARAGAAAVSVLTEPSRFDGSMAHLELATRVLTPLSVPAGARPGSACRGGSAGASPSRGVSPCRSIPAQDPRVRAASSRRSQPCPSG